MKYCLFSLGEAERPALDSFRESRPDIDLETHREALSANNKEVAKGAAAVIVSQVQPIPDEVWHYLKENGLKVVATRSAGYDMYNTALLKELGIPFCNVPSYSPEAIAEYVIAAGMYLSRNLHIIRRRAAEYDFRWNPEIISTEIRKKTVGIMGTGRIGRIAGRNFAALGAKVIACDLYENEEAKAYLSYTDKETLFAESDIISIHMPATEDNYHMINEESLKTFKRGAILINAARGSIVDTKALLKALDEGVIAGAALDTYEHEAPFVAKDKREDPPQDEILAELLKRENVIYTPHIAYYTHTAVKALFDTALQGAEQLLKNEDCPTRVV